MEIANVARSINEGCNRALAFSLNKESLRDGDG